MRQAAAVLIVFLAGAAAGWVTNDIRTPDRRTIGAQQACPMLCLYNRARAARGLRPLRWVSDPTTAKKADLILACDEHTHTPCGRPVYNGWRFELIASELSTRETFYAWMHSPPHRGAVLNRSVRGFTAVHREPSDVWVVHLR